MKKAIFVILTIFIATLQTQAQSNIKLGANANYHIPMSNQKEGTSPFLFLNSAQSAGMELSFAPNVKSTTRIKLAADYIIGSNNNENIAAYAKANIIDYRSYKLSKAKPSGFSIMASPQFMLFPKSKRKKMPLVWLDFKAGAIFSNQQNLQFFTGQTTASKEIKSNAVSFAYAPSIIVNVVKTKKLFLNLKAGYSSWGGFGFGLNITERDCMNVPCCKCYGYGTGCIPCAAEANNSLGN